MCCSDRLNSPPIHSKAPPVILTIEEERDAWWQDVIGAALLMVCL